MGNIWSKLGNTSSRQDGESNNLPSTSSALKIKDLAELQVLLVQARKAKDTLENKSQSTASHSSEASGHIPGADDARENNSGLRLRSRHGSKSSRSLSQREFMCPTPETNQSPAQGEVAVTVQEAHHDNEIEVGSGLSPRARAGGGAGTSHSPSGGELLTDPSQAPSVRFNVNDATQLDRIFDFMSKKNQSSRNNPVLDFFSGNVEGVGTSSERLSSALARQGIRQQNEPQSHAFLRGVYQILPNFHWINLGLSLFVDGLLRRYKMKKNSDACWSILEDLEGRVRSKIPHLGKAYPEEVDRIQAVIWILEAVIMCEKHLRSGVISRFFYVDVTEDHIKGPQARIAEISKALSTAAVNNQGDSVPIPRETREQETTSLGRSEYTKGTVGLEEKVPEVLSILGVTGKEIQRGVQGILLYGMGGIGKTTLGREVCAKIPNDDKYAQVEVGWKPSNENICRLQGLIYRSLSGTQPEISTWEDGQKQLEDLQRTCTAPVLLFIDNVFRPNDLSKLLPRRLDLPDGSCIVVTSRDRTVLEALENIVIQYHSYEVRKLQESESKALFDDIVGGCPPDKEELSSSVLQKCDGWPLALSLIGGYLKRRKNDLDAWNDTLDCLRNCEAISSRSEDDIIEILRWTYERLDKNAQNLFLDACLLRYQPWEWIESLGRSNALDCLQDLSLVKKRKSERTSEQTLSWRSSERSIATIEIHDLFFSYGRRATPSSPMTRIYFANRTEIPSCLQDNVEVNICVTFCA